MKCVILAGGSGTRFWPYSRHSNPKQLLNIVGEKSMLQMTIERLEKIKKITDIYIVTRQDLYDRIIKEIDGIDKNKIKQVENKKNALSLIDYLDAFQNEKELRILGNPRLGMVLFLVDVQ